MIDPAPESARVKAGHEKWLVAIGICTHLGCVPLGNKPTDPRGELRRVWFCPCHGSQYDVSGRVRHGPAPAEPAAAALRLHLRHQDQDRLRNQDMAGLHKSEFKNPVINWVDTRMPVFTLMQKEYGAFPTPKNFNYFWNFGALAMINLVVMIATGVFLAMHYDPSKADAFNSVQRIMRDVNYGWLLRLCARQRRLDVLHRRLHPHLPGALLRFLQEAARTAVHARRGHLPADDGDRVHGLRAAMGPDELLGRHGHHQPVLGRALRRRQHRDPAAGAASASTTRRSTASSRCITCCRS